MTEKHPFSILVGVLYVPVVVGLGALFLWEYAYVLSTLWRWFAMPRGLPGLGLGECAGVISASWLFRATAKVPRKDWRSPEEQLKALASYAALPWVTLALAWLFL